MGTTQKSKARKKRDWELVGGLHLYMGLSGRSALGRAVTADSLQEARVKSWPGRGGEVQRVWGRRQPGVFRSCKAVREAEWRAGEGAECVWGRGRLTLQARRGLQLPGGVACGGGEALPSSPVAPCLLCWRQTGRGQLGRGYARPDPVRLPLLVLPQYSNSLRWAYTNLTNVT